LDPDSELANQVLSASLLLQRKDADNSSLVHYQLQRNPENSSTHTSAGYLALHQGKYQEANQHFAEALRLDPSNEGARLGLVESFRSRNAVYRSYLKFSHWMNRFSEGNQMWIMIGGYMLYRILLAQLRHISPILSGALIAVWLLFSFWTHLARGVGGFFMLFDRFARLSLRRIEFWEGLVVGGLTCISPLVLILAVWRGGVDPRHLTSANLDVPIVIVASYLLTALTFAAAFTNDHYRGRYVYWAAAGIVGLALVIGSVGLAFPKYPQICFFAHLISIGLGVVMSWLRSFRVGYC
jgi:tetratricopeptide (TPR) repeat protein